MVLGFLFAIFFPFEARADELDLQKLINQSLSGEELQIPAGVYSGPITIQKEISLVGNGDVIIEGDGEKPIISVTETENVKIQSLTLHGQGNGDGNSGIHMKDVKNIAIEEVKMTNVTSGVKAERARKLYLSNLTITGLSAHFSEKGNGLSIYDSDQIEIYNTTIHDVQDGFYMERVEQLKLVGNHVSSSRYGIHIMYVDYARASDNEFQENVTGMMIMMTNNTDIVHNFIYDHQELNGSGMILFEGKHINIENNEIVSNTVGLSLQSISDSIVKNNQFRTNQTGVTLVKSAKETKVTNNEFSGNIVNLRSDENGGIIHRNYYDDYQGLDMEEDGIGDTPYSAVQSFGQWMVRKPVYQYFVEAPAVVLLNELDSQTKQTGTVLIDEEPKMSMTTQKREDKQINFAQLIGALLLVLGLIGLWRKEALI